MIERLNFGEPTRLDTTIIPTYDKLLEFIGSLGLNPQLHKELLEKAKSLPPGSYGHFMKNVDSHILRLMK